MGLVEKAPLPRLFRGNSNCDVFVRFWDRM